MGQGVHTVALQVAAQELGVDPGRIDVIVDTTRQLGFGQTTGSRGTLIAFVHPRAFGGVLVELVQER